MPSTEVATGLTDHEIVRAFRHMVGEYDRQTLRIEHYENEVHSLRVRLSEALGQNETDKRESARVIQDLGRRCRSRAEEIKQLAEKLERLMGMNAEMIATHMGPAERARALRASERLTP